MKNILYIVLASVFLNGCATSKSTAKKVKTLRFIDEYVIPENTQFKNTLVGGLSGIDFYNNQYYAISDDKANYRFYTLTIDFNPTKINHVSITDVTLLKTKKLFDLESIRVNKDHLLITNEGNIRKGKAPSILKVGFDGELIQEISSSQIMKQLTPRNNGTFEGLSVNDDSYFVGMELPFVEDGEEPKLTEGNYPVRISKVSQKTNKLENQFVYLLDKIERDSKPSGKFTVNGLSELIQLTKHTFLTIERAYASGHKDGGNNVKIYLADNTNATDISNIKSLKNSNYIPAKKELLLDFETIRSKLTEHKVDNIEGITFGPKLPNGNPTIIVIADNNFNTFSKQLNQIIVFEVMP